MRKNSRKRDKEIDIDEKIKTERIIEVQDTSEFVSKKYLLIERNLINKPNTKNNFCLRLVREDESGISEDTFNDEEENCENNNESVNDSNNEEKKTYCTRHFCGLVHLQLSDKIQLREKEQEILLYSTPRFKSVDIKKMLERVSEAINNSEESKKADGMFEDICCLGEEIVDDKLKEAIHEKNNDIEELIRLVRSINENDEKKTEEKYCTFSINMAKLFEVYVRICIQNAVEKSEWVLEPYVGGKEIRNDKHKNNEYGAIRAVNDQERQSREYIDGYLIPDYVIRKENEFIIFDAKYKKCEMRDKKNNFNRNDRLQLLAYAYAYSGDIEKLENCKCIGIGHIFPECEAVEAEINRIDSNGSKLYYKQFSMKELEDDTEDAKRHLLKWPSRNTK